MVRPSPPLADGPHRPEAVGLREWSSIVWGIFIGGCVSGETTWSEMAGTDAHAHQDAEWAGWICIYSGRAALTKGKPSQLLLHELAHLLVSGGHNDRWRSACAFLGASKEAKKYPKILRSNRAGDDRSPN